MQQKTILHCFLLFLGVFIFLGAGCDGDDDDSGSGDDDQSPAEDDDTVDDDAVDDDIVDDDSDDDTADDDTVDDDTVDDDTADDDTVDDDTVDDDTVDDDTTPDDDDTTPVCDYDSYNPMIDAGKSFLETRDANSAYDEFFEAQMLCPDEPAGMVGIALSDTQWTLNWLQTLIESLLWLDPSPKDKSFPTVLQQMIRDHFLPVNQEILTLLDDLTANHPDVEFTVATLPLWTTDDVVTLDLGGEWDASGLQNLRALTELLEGLERLLLSFDLTFNYNTFAFWPIPASGAPMDEVIHAITGLLIALIEDPGYPNLLHFLEGGQNELSLSGINFGFGCLDGVEAFAMIREETDDQTDDVFGYFDENANGQWDEGENYTLPQMGPLDDETEAVLEDFLVLLADLGPALLDTGPEDLHPLWPDWLPLSDLNVILDLLGDPVPGLELPGLPVPVGRWFYNPPADGIRSLVYNVSQILYDLTMPVPATEVQR